MVKYLVIFMLTWQLTLTAEIQKIILKWNAALCLDQCVAPLLRQLDNIPGIANIQVNAQAGIAEVDWKPNAPFSYYPFNTAYRSAGVRVTDVRIKVRGTVVIDSDNNFYLVSLGDNTRFVILGPLSAKANRYIIQSSGTTHPLPPHLREQLLQAQQSSQLVTIEGQLFQPEFYTLAIVAEIVNTPEENKRDLLRRGDPRLKTQSRP